ncbi:hypothetical protein [Helicobacter burdigaliensis]|uniref:hypothetical protein n=1 Tax=Helicobacter burdigaliensis TaxID=2315334 RepID=UPI000EF65CFB|nr:hypothetical protein [Helicobacter burdigaliensis]
MTLKMDNFLSFAIVNGFFIGLLLSFLKFDEPEMIVAWTLIATIGFYLITLVSVSFFMHFFDDKNKANVNKSSYNRILEDYIEEFDKRERTTNKIRNFLRTMEKSAKEEEDDEAHELSKNNSRQLL